MTDTWRTLPEGAAAGLSGNVRGETGSETGPDSGELRNDYSPFPISPEAESFIESAKILAEPWQEEVDRLRAELAAASTRFATALDEQAARLEQARKERRDAMALLARVRAVLDECDAKAFSGTAVITTRLVRAAIDGSES